MKLENWKAVATYEGIYLVSDLGRVMSARTGEILKRQISNKGYYRVRLYKDDGGKWIGVHRLVAAAFCKKPDGCDVVNHLDNTPTNNVPENLEWTTTKGNLAYADMQGRRAAALAKAIASASKPVERINVVTGEIKYYPSIASTEKDGFSPSSVRKCCHKERERHGGYLWRFANG